MPSFLEEFGSPEEVPKAKGANRSFLDEFGGPDTPSEAAPAVPQEAPKDAGWFSPENMHKEGMKDFNAANQAGWGLTIPDPRKTMGLEDYLKTGKEVVGNVGKALSPLSYVYGAARSAVGQPMAKAGQMVDEILHQVDPQKFEPRTQEQIFQEMSPGIDLALGAIGSRGAPPHPGPPPIPTTQPERLLEAGARQGIDVPRAIATENPVTKSVGSALSNLYAVGSPIVEAARTYKGNIGANVEALSNALGSGDRVAAGKEATKGIVDWINGDMPRISSRVYRPVDNAVDMTWIKEPENLQDVVSRMTHEAASMGQPVSKAAQMVEEAAFRPGGIQYVADPATMQGGIKGLKEKIGAIIDGRILPEGTTLKEWKRVYAAAAEDYKAHVMEAASAKVLSPQNQAILQHQGIAALPQAEQLKAIGAARRAEANLQRANDIFKQLAERRQRLTDIVGVRADATPEEVISSIIRKSNPTSGDIQGLRSIKKSVDPATWEEITSAILHDVGRDLSTQDKMFSPARFSTTYGKNISLAARDVLFGRKGTPVRDNLEDLWTLSQGAKRAEELSNVSRTAPTAAIFKAMGVAAALVVEPFTGLAAATKVLSSFLGGRILAQMLARPATSVALRRWTNARNRALIAGTRPSVAAFEAETANLARHIGNLGYDEDEIKAKLLSKATQ